MVGAFSAHRGSTCPSCTKGKLNEYLWNHDKLRALVHLNDIVESSIIHHSLLYLRKATTDTGTRTNNRSKGSETKTRLSSVVLNDAPAPPRPRVCPQPAKSC
eukprot:g81087.t1